MATIEQMDLSVLPENARAELYDFYLFLKQRYAAKSPVLSHQTEHQTKVDRIFPRKLAHKKPFTRDEIYG